MAAQDVDVSVREPSEDRPRRARFFPERNDGSTAGTSWQAFKNVMAGRPT